jgi:hypothetical protein
MVTNAAQRAAARLVQQLITPVIVDRARTLTNI